MTGTSRIPEELAADLKIAADHSRGRFHPLWDAGTLLEELPAGATTTTGQQRRVPPWNR